MRAITEFLFNHKTNLCALEQHIEDGHFFMRVEWENLDSDLVNSEIFEKSFREVKDEYKMDVKIDFNNRKKKLGLFCSKELHCLIDVLGRVEIGEINMEIPFVISNFEDARSVTEKFGVPFFQIKDEAEQIEVLKKNSVDVVGLARYMKVLSAGFINEIGNDAIINVHHSFLPSFVGANPYSEAHQRGVKLIGATAHFVTPELDQGPIIEQSIKRVNHGYDIDGLKVLGREIEKEVFAFAIKKFQENKLLIYKNRVVVFA